MKRLGSYLLAVGVGSILGIGSARAQVVNRVHAESTGSRAVIRIEGQNLKSPQVSLWKGNLLVVEFAARFSGKGSKRSFSTPHTSYIRYGWFTANPPRSRVVVTLKGKPTYKVQGSSAGYAITVGGSGEEGLKDFGKEMGKQMGEALGEVLGAFSEALGESLSPSELDKNKNAEVASEKPMLTKKNSSAKDKVQNAPPPRAVAMSGLTGNSGDFTGANSAPPPGETRISLDFVGAEIGDVLKALAIQSGANIVTSSDVKGAITVSLNNVSVEESLDLVTRLSGYHYRRIASTYVVGTPKSLETFESRGEVGSVVETVMLAIASPADAAKYIGARFPNVQISIPEAPAKPAYLLIKGFANEVMEAKHAALEFEQTITGGAEIMTEAYRIQYAEASDLIRILNQLVPGITVTLGPQPINVNLTGEGVPSLGSASGSAGGSQTAGAPTGGAASSNAQPHRSSPALIILMGPPRDILKALDVLKKVDVKVQQVLIEARVADLSEGAMQSLGFSWNVLQSGQVNNLTRDNPVPMPLDPDKSYPNQQGMEFNKDGDLTLGFSLIKSPLDLSISLSAVFEDRRNRLLANPRVAVLDGREATIFIGDEVNYVKLIQQTPQGANVETDRVNAGIILNVIPRIHEDGKITLHIKPEVSVISGFLQVPGGGSLPQVAKRTAQTTVRVQDGETIVIGGLIRESDIRAVQKVPLLGDLPIIGQLFRKTSNSKNKSEVVIMITVQILKD